MIYFRLRWVAAVFISLCLLPLSEGAAALCVSSPSWPANTALITPQALSLPMAMGRRSTWADAFSVRRWAASRDGILSLEGQLPRENYVLVANHVNLYGIDGIFLTAVILWNTRRWTAFITNPVNAALRLLARLDLVIDLRHPHPPVNGHSHVTTFHATEALKKNRTNVGFFPLLNKHGKDEWHEGFMHAAVDAGKKVVLIEISTTITMGATFQSALKGLFQWAWQGFRHPPYFFKFRVAEILDPAALGGTSEERKAMLSLRAKRFIVEFRDREHTRHRPKRTRGLPFISLPIDLRRST